MLKASRVRFCNLWGKYLFPVACPNEWSKRSGTFSGTIFWIFHSPFRFCPKYIDTGGNRRNDCNNTGWRLCFEISGLKPFCRAPVPFDFRPTRVPRACSTFYFFCIFDIFREKLTVYRLCTLEGYARGQSLCKWIIIYSFFSYKPTERKYRISTTTKNIDDNYQYWRPANFFLNAKIVLYVLFYTLFACYYDVSINFYEIILDRPIMA